MVSDIPPNARPIPSQHVDNQQPSTTIITTIITTSQMQAASRFPMFVYQSIPLAMSSGRIEPRIGRYTSLGMENDLCAYCLQIITADDCYFYDQCHHYMHTECVVENLLENGISSDGYLYCPVCRRTS